MDDTTEALRTPLHDLHLRLGAKIVPFAGYAMPLQYPAGIMTEHLHCRSRAGLFDVSHMGQVELRAQTGGVGDAARALERLVPVDILGLKPGRQRYAMFTNEDGGIVDDLMVANLGDRLVVVVNAACKAADLAHMEHGLGQHCRIRLLDDRALIALQGPEAEPVLASLAPETAAMRFMDVREATILGAPAVVSRSGYTGEDGFEISVPASRAEEIAEALLADPAVQPIGLGARDSLRLEAGLCLYGNDIDEGTSPVEAALSWAIQKVRREDGERTGGFPGAGRILRELKDGTSRRRVGLKPEGRAPVRGGAALFVTEEGGEAAGRVTSGGFGPSLGAPVSMGYVPTGLATPGTRLYAEVRGRRLPVDVTEMPFIPTTYKKA